MKTRTELLYLLGWVVFALLFLSPVLLQMSESLTEGWVAMPSVHAQLVTNVVISLCIFLLPALFLPSGREALRAVIRPLPPRYGRAGYLLRILALVAVTILSSNLLYDGILELSKLLGSPVQDQVEEVVVGMIRQGSLSFGSLFLALALVPALVEEIFFRGLLPRAKVEGLPLHCLHLLPPTLLSCGLSQPACPWADAELSGLRLTGATHPHPHASDQ